MAQVPYTSVPTQDPNENIKLPATAGSFGAGVANELGNLGDSVTNLGMQLAKNDLAKQGLENELYANDANTEAMKEISAAYSEYQKNEGQAAQAKLPEFQQKLQDIHDRSIAKMPGLESKTYLGRALSYTVNSYLNYSRSHADREFGKWMDASATAGFNAMKEQAVLAQNNPEQMEVFIDGAMDQVRKLLEAQGWDETIIEDKVKDKQSEVLSAVVTSAFQRDPAKGKALFDQYSGEIIGADRANLEQTFRAFNTDVEADKLAGRISTGGETADLIRQEEDYREGAYWDVNAYRTGYGSDTYQTADGKIHAVTADTVVSREDAERDLSRRIGEFAGRAATEIGQDAWNNLSSGARAAITSVTYNYGNTPDSVTTAAKTGDPQKIAAAIAALSANPARRQREAAVALGGLIPKADAIEQTLQATADRPDLRSRTLGFLEQRYNVQEARTADLARQMEMDTRERRDRSLRAEDLIMPYMFPDLSGKKPPENFGQIIANNQDLLPDSKRQMLQMLQTATEAESVTSGESAKEASDLLRRMRLPVGDPSRIDSNGSLYQAYIDKRIKRTDLDWLIKQQTDMRTPEGQTIGSVQDKFFSGVKSQITRSNDLLQQYFPDQDLSFFEFQQYVQQVIQRQKAAGKDPFDLFNPQKPEYLGNPGVLAPFQKSLMQQMQDQLKKIPDAGTMPSTGRSPIVPIYPGESIEDYNIRTRGPALTPDQMKLPAGTPIHKKLGFGEQLDLVERALA